MKTSNFLIDKYIFSTEGVNKKTIPYWFFLDPFITKVDFSTEGVNKKPIREMQSVNFRRACLICVNAHLHTFAPSLHSFTNRDTADILLANVLKTFKDMKAFILEEKIVFKVVTNSKDKAAFKISMLLYK